MTHSTTVVGDATRALAVPRELWLAAALSLIFSYLLFSESGVVLTQHWELAHEFFHDGRHLFGVPCH